MSRIFIIITKLLLLTSICFPFNTSIVFDDIKNYIHIENSKTNHQLSFLLNDKTNLLFHFCFQNNQLRLSLGDMWLNFGRGIVIGNTKYNYFTKYQTSQKILTNTSYPFNIYYPTTRGIFIETTHLTKTSIFFFSDQFFLSNKNTIGAMLSMLNWSFLITEVQNNNFISINYRDDNLLGLGVVSDIEISTKISSNLLFGLGVNLEWYYKRFEFSTEIRIQDENFISPLSSKMFSRQNFQKGLIFSGKLNEKDRKISVINKITSYSNSQFDNEFFLFLAQKVFRNTFLDIEITKNSFQNLTFLSIFPFFDFDFLYFSVKPIITIEQTTLNRIEGEIKLSISNVSFKFNLFYPIIRDCSYTFTSMETRDLFGENIDIKTQNNEGLKTILSIIFFNNTINTEIGFSISEIDFKTYGTIVFRIQP